jgi:hypothetical protein
MTLKTTFQEARSFLEGADLLQPLAARSIFRQILS